MSLLETESLNYDEAVRGLDKLIVKRDGNVQFCIGLLYTVYFKNGNDPAVRKKVIDCFELYQEKTGYKLVWGADPKTGNPKKLAGTQIANLRSWVPSISPDESIDLVFHGGEKRDDASHYMVQALLQQEYEGELSNFTVALPLSWVAHQPKGAFVRLVVSFCDHLQPYHGYAGLAVIPFVNVSDGSEIMNEFRALVMRFHGLEIDFPESHSLYLQEAIKGVNWLTVLDKCWIDKLGGKDSLLKQLGEGFVFHDYKTGTVIQAGPNPAFGDVNHNEKLPYYMKLSKVLKPIRVDYPTSFGRMGYFNKEQAQAWLSRFDE